MLCIRHQALTRFGRDFALQCQRSRLSVCLALVQIFKIRLRLAHGLAQAVARAVIGGSTVINGL